jgi:superfamily II DNA/RNA helicase
MPDAVDAWKHRIGRTGGDAKTGDVFTFTTCEQKGIIRGIEGKAILYQPTAKSSFPNHGQQNRSSR